jgi:NAD(P)-dependent dehydrogenase (short-subunit alcohol dehydrogenase family)
MDASDRLVTVFGGTGFLGRRIVRHLRLDGFFVRVASRHPDRGKALRGPDDPQLRWVKADVYDERSVADALASAYGSVNAVSLFMSSGDARPFIPSMSRLLNGSRLRRGKLESNGLFMFRGLVPILARHRSISENAAKANWRFGRLFPMPF